MDDQPTTPLIKDLVNNFLTETETNLRESCALTNEHHLSAIAIRRFMNNKLIVDNEPKRKAIHKRMRTLSNQCVCMLTKYAAKHKEDKELADIVMKAEHVAAYAVEIKPALSINCDKWG